jgi:hypothetical protein
MTRELTKADNVVRYDLIEAGGEVNVELLTRMVAKVREVRERVMERGAHYMRIPGTEKDSLTSAGADTLNLAFDLLPKYEVMSAQRSDKVIAYVVRCEIFSKADGRLLGSGMGSCNTNEQKYQNQLRSRNETAKRKNAEPITVWELDNTIVKMASKRAKVDAVLGTTAARELFTQDMDELEDTWKRRKLNVDKALGRSPRVGARPPPRSQPPPPPTPDGPDVTQAEPPPEETTQVAPAPPPQQGGFGDQTDGEIRATLLKIADCSTVNPTDWQNQFMADMVSKKFPMSPKQREICHKIINQYIDYVYAEPTEEAPY